MRRRPALVRALALGVVCLVGPGWAESSPVQQPTLAAAAGAARKLAPRLRALLDAFRAEWAARGAAAAGAAVQRRSSTTLKVDGAGRVQVYVHVADTTPATLAAVRQQGLDLELTNADFGILQGWVPAERLEALAAEAAVLRVRVPGYGRPRAGSVQSEGVTVHRCPEAAGLTGAGVAVGVVSDGVSGLAASQASGDLPAVQILRQGPGDEGTALLEIIHDCAPGATLLFASGGSTSLAFVDAVNALRDAGARIIVDDLGFTDQPFFEDGFAALNDRTVGAAALRVSAAGNDGQNHYQGTFSPGAADPTIPGIPPVSIRHDFGGGDTLLRIRMSAFSVATLILQWANPVGAAGDDYDLCVRRPDGSLVTCALTGQDGTGDPYETVDVACASFADCLFDVQITLFAGLPRLLELFCFNGSCDFLEFNAPHDAIYGHPAVPEVLAVGASPAAAPTALEPYSSGGPATILFPVPEARPKPDVNGIDGVLTSRPGFAPFLGTSAAAPHVAAVAALVLQANPAIPPGVLRDVLRRTAVDLGPPGFDAGFGFGRADAVQAVADAFGLPGASSLTLALNGTAFGPGQTLVLTATVTPGVSTPLADAYVVVRLPGGSFLSLLLDGTLVPGLVPIARGFVPLAFNGEVLRFTLTGAEPPGAYAWLGALTHAGTLTVIGAIDEDAFTITP
jgi:subtilisin family serine protease